MALGFVLRLGYMNDVTLGGSQDAVARDVQTVMDVGHEMGLDLNISKCELLSHPGCVVSDPALQSFLPVPDAELLGAPLFPGTVLDAVWSQHCNDLARAVDRLPLFCLGLLSVLQECSHSSTVFIALTLGNYIPKGV